MKSYTTARFRELYRDLPKPVRNQARRAYKRFIENPQHPGLRFKLVHSSKPIYSARISRDYRALGTLDVDNIIWFWIGNHDDYERLLNRL